MHHIAFGGGLEAVKIVTTSTVASDFSPAEGSMPITSVPLISQPSILVSGFSSSTWGANFIQKGEMKT